jgi:hypothetical protein
MPDFRNGRTETERRAIARLASDVAAMPASDVVQLLLWPQNLADWARSSHVAPAVAYNMLSRFKPYRRVREFLAARLEVPGWVLDHLVDAPRPLPGSLSSVPPERSLPDEATRATDWSPDHADLSSVSPTERLPSVRDGSNPLERRAVWRVRRHVAAIPASTIVQLAIFPESLAEWARRRVFPPSVVYTTLAGSQRNPRIRDALARRIGVPTRDLDTLLDSPRPEPEVLLPPSLSTEADTPDEFRSTVVSQLDVPGVEERQRPADRPGATGEEPEHHIRGEESRPTGGQLDLGI